MGRGLWRRAHDSFVRALDRFHQVLERFPDEAQNELVPVANGLAELLPVVRRICIRGHQAAPWEGMEIPLRFAPVHRELTRAGAALATAAQALVLAEGAPRPESSALAAVQRHALEVAERVRAADEALAIALRLKTRDGA